MATKEEELDNLLKTDTPPITEVTEAERLKSALKQMNFSDAAIKLLDPNNSDTDMDSLQSIASAQELVIQVKNSLSSVIDSMEKNPSIISQAATYWGSLELWQKIAYGFFLSGPTLVIGVAANIGFLMTLGGASAVVYTTGGIVLDDHYYHTKHATEKLKDGVYGITEVLGWTIASLDTIRKKLAREVDRFKEENERLTANVTKMGTEIDTLSMQVATFIAIEKLWRTTKEDLEQTVEKLKKELVTESELFNKTQHELEQAKESYKRSTIQLDEKVAELNASRQNMGQEIARAKRAADNLKTTLETMSTTIGDPHKRQEFIDGVVKMSTVAENFNETEIQLRKTQEQLSEKNQQYDSLLKRHEVQVERLTEYIDRKVAEERRSVLTPTKQQPKVNNGGLLSAFGLMSKPVKEVIDENTQYMPVFISM